jgi:hypothetical protein
LSAAAVGVFATSASAVPIGTLRVANCAGGGVTVTATSIDWLPPGGGTGCIETGTGTSVAYTAGTLLPGVTGTILDLVAPTPFPVLDFMVFAGHPNLHFDLNSVGPGVANLVCSVVLDPNQPACSAFPGSPFILAPTATGTSVTLSVFGTARDASPDTSTWLGAFTTQIAGITPAAIQSAIGQGGSVTSTHSGEFVVTANPVIPEPASMLLLGTGLLGTGLLRRRLGRRK